MYSDYTQTVTTSRPSFDFVAAHFACELDRYSVENPNGFVNLGSAQNHLAKQDLAKSLPAIQHDLADAEYHPFTGSDDCKIAVAAHLETYCRASISPKQILLGNGLIGLLESLALAVCNRGDRVLVPTPVFPGLVKALSLRTGIEVELLSTQMKDDFRVTPELVANAIDESTRNGQPIKAVLLCSPGNPIGHVYSHSELLEFVRIVETANIALIVDEVYAQSCFEDIDFESAIDFSSEHVFVLGGLSKDFGVAGYAVGWLHGTNDRIMKAVASQSHFFRLSTPAQRATEHLLSTTKTADYLRNHRRRISDNFQLTKDYLRSCNVETLDAQAGLCAVLDLRSYLSSPDEVGELQLYRHLLDEHRVHLSPSVGFLWSQPGLFRICVTSFDDTLREGLRRIREGLLSVSNRKSLHKRNRKVTSCPLQTLANSSQSSSISKTS